MSDFDAIPQELKELSQWVNWKWTNEHTRKLPVQINGEPAQSNNPATWTTFEEVCNHIPRGGGIGFMFSNGYFGVDLDDVDADIADYKNGGTGSNMVAEFIHTLRSYAEYSVSGTGIHIICKGTLPPTGRRYNNVEMYDSGRFFIMTGNAASKYREILECTHSIKPLHAKYIGADLVKVAKEQNDEIRSYASMDASDSEIIAMAERAVNGDKFHALYNGSWQAEGFPSQSEADIAFLCMLAYWTRNNSSQMDSIFRSSGLMRDKWDRAQSGSTYGRISIAKAVSMTGNDVYSPYSITIEGRVQKPIKNPVQDVVIRSFDDTGNALRIKDMFGESIRFNYTTNGFYFYTGKKWQLDYGGAIMTAIDDTVEALGRQKQFYLNNIPSTFVDGLVKYDQAFERHLKRSRSHSAKLAMRNQLQNKIEVKHDALDRYPYLFNCDSGVIDLNTGTQEAHRPEFYLTHASMISKSDSMECPMWKKFLREIFDERQQLVDFIQRAVGYSLSGDISEQCMFILNGDGANGKSVFMSVLMHILGDYAVTINPDLIMQKGTNTANQATPEMVRTVGARIVYAEESNEGVRLDEGLVKRLTGGSKITARAMYGSTFEFMPEFKLWLATNHKPKIKGEDYGIWRRMFLIPFDVVFPPEKQDRELVYKLRSEAPSILNWALGGYRMWKAQGLQPPDEVKQATDEYKSESSSVLRFIEDAIIPGGLYDKTASKVMYNAYKVWCSENGEYVHSKQWLNKHMPPDYEPVREKNGLYFDRWKVREHYRTVLITGKEDDNDA